MAYVYISLAIIFWGVSFVVTKIALREFDVVTLLAVRFTLALAVILPVLVIKKDLPVFSVKEHAKIFLLSIFEPVLYFYFETQGLRLTSAANASLIVSTIPVAVLVLSFLVLKEAITFARVSGILLSIAGIVCIITGAAHFSWASGGSTFRGELYVVGAVVSAALYTVMLRDLAQRHSPLHLTAMQIVYGTVFFLLPALPHLHSFRPAALSPGSVVAVVYLAVFCTVFAFLFYTKSLSRIPASQASVFVNCIPVVTVLASRLLLNERLMPMQFLGAGIVVLGVMLSNSNQGAKTRN